MDGKLLGGLAAILMLVAAAAGIAAERPDAGPLLQRIKSVGKEGAGGAEAARAWKELVQLGPRVLPEVLAAMDGAGPQAENWLRAAVDAIAERELAAGRPLPARELEAFVQRLGHDPKARRLAYEWLSRADPSAPGRLLPGMLLDPSTELRRDAVALVLADAQQLADKKDKAAATAAYQKALTGARDRDQVDLIAKQLKGLGVDVDLPGHFGFIQTWMLLGPFDHTGGVGFAAAYPPERAVDLFATYPGTGGTLLRWTEHSTSDAYGLVDLNKAVGKHMGAVAYAFATVHSPREQPVEIRAGSNNAVKLFLNGTLLLAHEEYHHGTRMDQYIGKGTLKAGRNEILVKVCQNEQTEDWAQTWSFQLRVCDAVGGAAPLVKTPSKGQP